MIDIMVLIVGLIICFAVYLGMKKYSTEKYIPEIVFFGLLVLLFVLCQKLWILLVVVLVIAFILMRKFK